MIRWIPIFLVSCSSLAGYADVKPEIENFDEPLDTLKEEVIDSDSIWDTGFDGDTGKVKKESDTGVFIPYSEDTY